MTDQLENEKSGGWRWRRERYFDDDDGTEKTRIKKYMKTSDFEPTKAKVVISGPQIETYEYSKQAYLGRKMDGCGRRAGHVGAEERKSEYRKQSSNRARLKLSRLAATNFDVKRAKFLTLTVSDTRIIPNTDNECLFWTEDVDPTDPKQMNVQFDNFKKRMVRAFGKFKYIAVLEFQKNGKCHYHIILDLDYVPVLEIFKIWGWGWVHITAIDNVDNIGVYVSKYITKDIDDPRLDGKKGYFCSQGLDQPVELKSYDAYEFLSELHWDKRPEIMQKQYGDEEDFIGVTTYRQFLEEIETIEQLRKRNKMLKTRKEIKARKIKKPTKKDIPPQ